MCLPMSEIKVKPSLSIVGSRDTVEVYGSTVHIGCLKRGIDWWFANLTEEARKHQYTPEQKREYYHYLCVIAHFLVDRRFVNSYKEDLE